jgi:hypothetical protein
MSCGKTKLDRRETCIWQYEVGPEVTKVPVQDILTGMYLVDGGMKGRASRRPSDWPRLELMKEVTIRIFHTRSAQEISPPQARPSHLRFLFRSGPVVSLGSSYITFLLRLVPRLSFLFPPRILLALQ